jgi:hypothetical protein
MELYKIIKLLYPKDQKLQSLKPGTKESTAEISTIQIIRQLLKIV